MWISHRYTYIPSLWTSLPAPSPSHPSRLIQSPCLSFLSHTANSRWLSLTYGNVSFHVTLSIHLTLSSPLSMSIKLFFLSVSPLSEWVSAVVHLSPIFCDPMDCSLPGSLVHGIIQARILKWVSISFSRGSSRPRDRTRVSHIVGRCFTIWATREVMG